MLFFRAFLLVSVTAPLLAQTQGEPRSTEEPAAATRPATAEELLKRFAAMQGLEARFTETKHLSLLALPLESSGVLYFSRPGHLVRVVERPQPSTLTITPRQLRMVGRNGTEEIDLGANPELRLFVTSLLRVFAGDRNALQTSYRIEYRVAENDEKAWTLTLEPKAKPLTEMIASLRIDGSAATVQKIVTTEPNGDRAVMEITAANPNRRFTDAERTRLFGIEPRRDRPAKQSR